MRDKPFDARPLPDKVNEKGFAICHRGRYMLGGFKTEREAQVRADWFNFIWRLGRASERRARRKS